MEAPAVVAVRAPDERVRPAHSLRVRLLLLVSLGGFAVVLALTLASYGLARRITLDNAYREVDQMSALTGTVLQDALRSPESTLIALGDTVRGIGHDPERLRALLRTIMAGDPSIMGAMLAMDAGALAPGTPLYSWYVRRDRDSYYEQSMMRDYDFRQMPWYVRTVTQRQMWWSEPYANEATAGRLVSTVNLPLPGDKTPGMVSLDVPVAHMRELVEDLQRQPGTRAFLLSPEGLFVVHPDPAVALKRTLASYVNAGRSDLLPVEQARLEKRPLTLHHRTSNDGVQRYTVFMPLGQTGWSFGLSVDETELLKRLDTATWRIALGGVVALLVMALGVLSLARRVTEPLAQLAASAQYLSEISHALPHTGRPDEVGLLARARARARDSIWRHMGEIERMAKARQKLDSELSIAREIQQAMLPKGRSVGSATGAVEVGALLEPAKSVGGDFYHFFVRDPGHLWFMLGDISDKGIPAALFMVRVLTLLEHAARTGAGPGEVLRQAALGLVEGNEACMFATVLCGLIDPDTGDCTLASAAHDAPLLLRADGRVAELPVTSGPALGLDANQTYAVWNGRLAAGETLLCYTDGITEAFDADNQAFGSERLQAALAPGLDAEAQCRRLVAAVRAFAGTAPQSDDIAVLAVRAGSRADLPVLHWTLNRDHGRVAAICREFDAALAARGLDAGRRHDAVLMVEEVLCNTLDHGFEPDAPARADLRARFDGSRVTLEFRDNGRAFDPLSQVPPALDTDPANRPVGGLGLHLIRELSESASYRRDGTANILNLTLKVPVEELKS